MHYVFDSLAAANAAIAAIDAEMRWPSTDGTKTYAEPLGHRNGQSWAVPCNAAGVDTETLRASGWLEANDPVELGADWWPAEEE